MEYGFITFRSHPCDKNLDMSFYQLMTPMLNKAERYIVAQEKSGTPDAHYHILMSFKGDITHLRQKFNTKPFKNWYEIVKPTMTVISSPKLDDRALQVKKVDKTEEDLMTIIGYVSKENVIKVKNFTEEEITEACKYYHATSRKAPKQEIDNSWKILNMKTAIPWIEKVATEEQLLPYDKTLPYHMARKKMYLDISDKQQEKVFTCLRIAHQVDKSEHEVKALQTKMFNNEDPILQVSFQQREIEHLKKVIAQYQQKLEEHDLEDTTEWQWYKGQ